MRLFKVIGTQPSSLLCFSEALRLSRGGLLAYLRKLNREVCQSGSRFDGALDPKMFLIWTIHTLMTLPGACHGCQQHSKHTHSGCASGKSFTFHYQKKMFIWRLCKTLDVCHLARFDKFYFSASQKHHTGKYMFFLVALSTTNYWKPESPHFKVRLCSRDATQVILTSKQREKTYLTQLKALCHTAIHICNALYDSTMQH